MKESRWEEEAWPVVMSFESKDKEERTNASSTNTATIVKQDF